MGALLARATSGVALSQVRHVTPVAPHAATGLVAAVYAQVVVDFGMLAPPVALHSPSPTLLAACWLPLRESLLATGAVPRPVKEVVAAAVSVSNRCPYCVQIHALSLHGLVRGPDARAVFNGDFQSIADPALRDIAQWAVHCGSRDEAAARPVPSAPEYHAELVGVAVSFHYLNRMVSAFLPDSPMPGGRSPAVDSVAARLAGRMLGSYARQSRAAGQSLDLLPHADPPPDLSWAAGSDHIAGAFARAAAAIEGAGLVAVPAPVRETVSARLATWDGRPPGADGGWLRDAVSGLDASDRAAGRLALRFALAPYQITRADIDNFQRDRPGDEALIGLAAWACMAAARRVGSWACVGQR